MAARLLLRALSWRLQPRGALVTTCLSTPAWRCVPCRGYTGAKEAGALRLEGKEYIVQEGDVMLFRFNV